MIDSIVAVSVPVLVLVAGLILLVFSSDTAVEHSVDIASALGASVNYRFGAGIHRHGFA
jgi:hypothetical protein